MPYVMGDRGNIVAILWGDPLHAPALANHRNKILWVSNVVAMLPDPLHIQATLHGTGRTATREVTGGQARPSSTFPRPGAGQST